MILLSAPIKVCIDILNECNLNCIHCHAKANELQGEMLKLNEIKDLITLFSEIKVFILQIGGGEPLMHPYFFDIVKHAKNCGLHIVMSTNATLITNEIAIRLNESGFKQMQVSLDGATAEVHDSFRRSNGSFEKTISGIANLVNAKVEVSIASTLSKNNLFQIKEMVALAKSLRASAFRTMCFMPGGRALNNLNLMLNYNELIYSIKLLRELKKQEVKFLHIEYEAPFIPKVESRPRTKINEIDEYFAGCEAGKRECRILANGNVVPCPLFSDPKFIAGNIRKESFTNIWKNSTVLNYFRNISYKNKKGKCTICQFGYLCNGGCPAVSYNIKGDAGLPDPRCNINLSPKLTESNYN